MQETDSAEEASQVQQAQHSQYVRLTKVLVQLKLWSLVISQCVGRVFCHGAGRKIQTGRVSFDKEVFDPT